MCVTVFLDRISQIVFLPKEGYLFPGKKSTLRHWEQNIMKIKDHVDIFKNSEKYSWKYVIERNWIHWYRPRNKIFGLNSIYFIFTYTNIQYDNIKYRIWKQAIKAYINSFPVRSGYKIANKI